MPKFQKRHYIAIAEVLSTARNTSQAYLFPNLDATIDTLAQLFARDNPRFDRERFLSACGR